MPEQDPFAESPQGPDLKAQEGPSAPTPMEAGMLQDRVLDVLIEGELKMGRYPAFPLESVFPVDQERIRPDTSFEEQQSDYLRQSAEHFGLQPEEAEQHLSIDHLSQIFAQEKILFVAAFSRNATRSFLDGEPMLLRDMVPNRSGFPGVQEQLQTQVCRVTRKADGAQEWFLYQDGRLEPYPGRLLTGSESIEMIPLQKDENLLEGEITVKRLKDGVTAFLSEEIGYAGTDEELSFAIPNLPDCPIVRVGFPDGSFQWIYNDSFASWK